MEDEKRYTESLQEEISEEEQRQYEQQAEELIRNADASYQPVYGNKTHGQNAGYPQQGGYDQGYGQPNGYDPRYAQPNGYDPRYAQPNGYDPRYAQQNGYYDPRYAQPNGYDPRYAQQYGYNQGYNPYENPQNGYYPDNGQYGYPQNGMPEDPNGYPADGSRYAGNMGDRIHESYENEYPEDEEPYEGEDFIDGEDGYEEEEPAPKPKKKSGFQKFIRKMKKKISRMSSRTLIIIGGAVIAVLVFLILLFAVILPGARKNDNKVEIKATETPAAIDSTPAPTEEPTPEPTSTPHPIETPLDFGMTADVVAEIQQRLIDLGYMDYPTLDDGTKQVTTVYGKITKNAVRDFQSKNGLDIDGKCGQLTYDMLMSDQAKAYYVSRGDTNDQVTKMQERLLELGYFKATPTGHCGESTVQAVQKFQQANGLDADGKAGQQTLQLLYSDQAINADGLAVPYKAPEATAPADSSAEAKATPTPAPDLEEQEDDGD